LSVLRDGVKICWTMTSEARRQNVSSKIDELAQAKVTLWRAA